MRVSQPDIGDSVTWAHLISTATLRRVGYR